MYQTSNKKQVRSHKLEKISLKIFNSLTRQLETFEPIDPDKAVGVYTCGPTVYSYVTIGNWRSYTLGDVAVRALRQLGYSVKYIMNITDVGHLTGDNSGDADTGEDRLEKAAIKEGKTAWDIADFYTQDFLVGFDKLNLLKPEKFTKATDHIQEQVSLVQNIEAKGLAYRISDGIYFDVAKYESQGHHYGQLSNIDQLKEGARVEPNPDKKDPRDFALWKFSEPGSKRHMEWDSPWGIGFPGWHIECSAMSMKYLGEQFDLHIGGEDLRSTHHPNEIAQSEAATNKKPFVKYWIHGAFLLVNGGRMGKSLGNAYTLHDIESRGYDPMALRYFYLTSHYRKPHNFTWESLHGAATALNRLKDKFHSFEAKPVTKEIRQLPPFVDFMNAVADDLNMPQAMAVVWDVLKSPNLADWEKRQLLLEFDQVLGLQLDKIDKTENLIPDEVEQLVEAREIARNNKDFALADQLRQQIKELGYLVKDTSAKPIITRVQAE